jgi:serine/threonine-protein kinase
VVHGNLSPRNISLPTDRDSVAVILDVGHTPSHSQSRPAGADVEWATYLAPEQAEAGAAIDGRADLYALGVLAFRALTGQPPFSHRSPYEVMRRHLTHPVCAPSVAAPRLQIPGVADAICLALLQKRPAARPRTADAVTDLLGAAT